MNANLAQSQSNPFHFRTQNYRGLMLGYQKEKMAQKPQQNTDQLTSLVFFSFLVEFHRDRGIE